MRNSLLGGHNVCIGKKSFKTRRTQERTAKRRKEKGCKENNKEKQIGFYMLRANGETGDIYGFLDEGGFISFENINSVNGEAVLTVKGKENIVKREFLFGQEDIVFSFTPEEINKIGEGEHPYSLYTKGFDGVRNTLIPDPSNNMRPVFQIET